MVSKSPMHAPIEVIVNVNLRNAPYVFGIRAAATAIATGNTAILKGSELTPRCYWAVGKAFHEAGLPAGVLNVLSCPPEKAEEVVTTMIEVCLFLRNHPRQKRGLRGTYLLQHSAVRKINFTGSASVGRKIARTCGQNLKPCLMELGGKNSAIVLEDADLQKAVDACVAGAFINASIILLPRYFN
jgi:acyl-CoA reductase-like NAD-dependent aldehyde dehydrogenase